MRVAIVVFTLFGFLRSESQRSEQAPVLRIDRIEVSPKAKDPWVRVSLSDLDEDQKVQSDALDASYNLLRNGVRENAPVGVETFVDRKAPMALMGVIQTSYGISETFAPAVQSLQKLIRALPSGSKVGLVAYAHVIAKDLRPTTPIEALRVLEELTINEEAIETNLMEAARTAVDALSVADLPSRRVVMIYSDGVTSADMQIPAFIELGKRAKKYSIKVHSIGFSPVRAHLLQSLAELSQHAEGTFRAASSPSSVKTLFDDLQREILRQAVLTFHLPKAFDGKVSVLQIESTSGARSNQESAYFSKPKAQPQPPPWRPWAAVGLALIVGAGAFLLFTRSGLIRRWTPTAIDGPSEVKAVPKPPEEPFFSSVSRMVADHAVGVAFSGAVPQGAGADLPAPREMPRKKPKSVTVSMDQSIEPRPKPRRPPPPPGKKTNTPSSSLDLPSPTQFMKQQASVHTQRASGSALQVTGGPDDGEILLLDEDKDVVVGAGDVCDFIVRGPDMAERQWKVRLHEQRCEVGDLSTDGEVPSPAVLQPGESVEVGPVRLVFVLDSHQDQGAPA